MSYGVELSKSVHVRVEQLVPHVPGYDNRRERFATSVVAPYLPGRMTLTRLRLSFVAARAGAGAASFVLDLTEIEAVELEAGRFPRLVTVVTADRRIHVRVTGAPAFAKRIAIAREAAQRTARGPVRRGA